MLQRTPAKHLPISGDLPASAAPTAHRPSWIRRPSPPWVPPAITGPRLQKRVLMPAPNFIVHAQKEVPIPAFSFYTKREMPRTTGMGFCVAQYELASSGSPPVHEESAAVLTQSKAAIPDLELECRQNFRAQKLELI
ncbi:hypothetical protein B0H10DRAFT_2220571 [Mycena sp. CBHHK59/15]|nr:hypothetical protein B0H10DRAFT_2220571 [Mycena sp. CBHHK59/15]